jgi:hypothetical protein
MSATARELLIAENAAALSACFHEDERYGNTYSIVSEELSGFPGIWKEMATVAIILTDLETEHEAAWDDSNWIELCDLTAIWIHDYCETNRRWPLRSLIEDKLKELMKIHG